MSRYAGSKNNNIHETLKPSELKWWLKEIDAQYEQRSAAHRKETPEQRHAYYLKRKALKSLPL